MIQVLKYSLVLISDLVKFDILNTKGKQFFNEHWKVILIKSGFILENLNKNIKKKFGGLQRIGI